MGVSVVANCRGIELKQCLANTFGIKAKYGNFLSKQKVVGQIFLVFKMAPISVPFDTILSPFMNG